MLNTSHSDSESSRVFPKLIPKGQFWLYRKRFQAIIDIFPIAPSLIRAYAQFAEEWNKDPENLERKLPTKTQGPGNIFEYLQIRDRTQESLEKALWVQFKVEIQEEKPIPNRIRKSRRKVTQTLSNS